MEFLSVLGFALALSFDGFGAGIAYGLRHIKIPVHCLLLINFTSCAVLALAMTGGHLIARYVNTNVSTWSGAIILIAVGVWTLYQTWSHRHDEPVKTTDNMAAACEEAAAVDEKKIFEMKIRPLGFVIQVFREPQKADIDLSGFLSTKESLLLGVALAMDAMGAGFGLAMSGFKPWLAPFLVGLVQFIMVKSGYYLGDSFGAGWLGRKAAILPGWILIAIGISRVIKF